MTISKLDKFWIFIISLLAAIIVIGGVVAWSRYSSHQPVEISISPTQELQGEIYLGGAVNAPGFYPLKTGDSVEAIIQAAGSTTSNADLSRLKLYIPEVGEEEQSQKVDINQAEAWLLEALPGIGEGRAKAIIAYRHKNGPFHNINELVKVEGIGATTYEKIKPLITVAD